MFRKPRTLDLEHTPSRESRFSRGLARNRVFHSPLGKLFESRIEAIHSPYDRLHAGRI